MKNISTQLAADIAAGVVCTAMLVTRTDGTMLAYTDHDAPLAYGSEVYTPAPGLSGIKLTITNNAAVGTVQARAAWLPVLQESDILSGLYDNAQIKIGAMSWKNPGYGILWLFSGMLGTVTSTADGFQAEAQSALWVLQRPLGVHITPTCRHTLGSTTDPQGVWGCQLDLTPYSYSGTITAMSNSMAWTVSIPGYGSAGTPNTPAAPTASVTQNIVGQYLAPGTYHYSVSAVVGGQESSTSPITTAVVQPNNPPTGGGEITLSWAPVAGATAYNVYGNTAQQLLATVTGTTWTDNGTGAQGGSPPLFGDFFAQGILTMTSGAASGLKTNVKTMTSAGLQLLLPLGRTPAVGDTFTVSAGCAKTAATCQYKFNNLVNFGGFPDLTPQRNWM